jgi:hypothetical protein
MYAGPFLSIGGGVPKIAPAWRCTAAWNMSWSKFIFDFQVYAIGRPN